MDKPQIVKALQSLRASASKRKFEQTVDCILNLKDLDLKKPEGQVDLYIQLPHVNGQVRKLCALVGSELLEQSKKFCDKTILSDDFKTFTDKKVIKKLAVEYTYFIAQANLMTEIAKVFGRTLGPRGKMPNPKAGAVIPANANLQATAERLRNTIRMSNKQQASIKVTVGKEGMTDDILADNILSAYQNTVSKLPSEKQNVREVLVKFTMSKPVKVQ